MSRAVKSRALLAGALALFGCGPGDIDPEPTSDSTPDLGDLDGATLGDPHNCGELGLDCTGPLNIGSCIDGACGPQVGFQCWSPQFAPTCDAYCQAFDQSCAYLGCDGATAYGWNGTQYDADYDCGYGEHDTMVSMTMSCDQPLAGIVMSARCCCQK